MDLIFGTCATFFSSISYTQTFVYPREKRNFVTTIVVFGSVALFMVIGVYQLITGRIGNRDDIVSLINMAALLKAASTATKYLF